MQLKAAYTLLEQLYTGSLRTIRYVMGAKNMPTTIKESLNVLSTLPSQLKELKLSAARAAAIFTLVQAKAYNEDLDMAELTGGFPQHNYEGKEFTSKDFNRLRIETRPIATKLAEEVNLERYQAAYNDAGERVQPSSFEAISLIPHGRKDCFVPEFEPSNLIEETDTFAALSSIDWDADEAQIAAAAKVAQDKLKAAQKKAAQKKTGLAGKPSGSTSSRAP